MQPFVYCVTTCLGLQIIYMSFFNHKYIVKNFKNGIILKLVSILYDFPWFSLSEHNHFYDIVILCCCNREKAVNNYWFQWWNYHLFNFQYRIFSCNAHYQRLTTMLIQNLWYYIWKIVHLGLWITYIRIGYNMYLSQCNYNRFVFLR